MNSQIRSTLLALLCSSALGLAGCGGDSDDTPVATATTISGTAAVGAPLTGTVTAVGANGVTVSVALASNGSFTLSSTNLTFPALVKADNGAGVVLYSWASAADTTTNITPLTTLALVLTELSDNLDAVFTAWSGSANAVTLAEMQAAQAIVNANLQAYFASAALDFTNYDFLTEPFAADGSGIDAVLDDLDFEFDFDADTFADVVSILLDGTSTDVAFDADVDVSDIAIGGASDFTPVITSFSPSSGGAGDSITINGSGFGDDPFHLQVSFPNSVAASIVSVTDTQIVITVPNAAVTGTITVTHGLSGANATTASAFTVIEDEEEEPVGGEWTERSSGSSFLLHAVAYGNSTFVAVGYGNTIISSGDGITWTSRSAPDRNSYILEAVIWDGAQFVLVGDVVGYAPSGTPVLIATSPDGITWTRRSAISSTGVAETWLSDVAAGGDRLTAVGKNGKILSSTDDGVTWSEQINPDLSGSYIAGYNGVAASSSVRVAVGGDTQYRGFIIVSTDGVNWTVTEEALETFYPWDVETNGSLFIAVGAAGAHPGLQTSPDGVTWTAQTLPESIASGAGTLNHVTWDGAQFIAVGSDGGNINQVGNRFVLTSPDGETWSLDQAWSTAGRINSLAGVATSPERAVVVGDSLWTQP
jgi:hypothetical protein